MRVRVIHVYMPLSLPNPARRAFASSVFCVLVLQIEERKGCNNVDPPDYPVS